MTTARALLCVALAGACSKSEPSAPPPAAHVAGPVAKDPEAARKLIASGATVIDVRTPAEYAQDHVPSAVNIPVQDFANRLDEVGKLVGGDRDRPVVLYCAKGGRAAKAKAQLDAAGYTHVVNGGGLDDLR